MFQCYLFRNRINKRIIDRLVARYMILFIVSCTILDLMKIHALPTVHFFMLSGSMRGFDDATKAIFDVVFDRIGVLW